MTDIATNGLNFTVFVNKIGILSRQEGGGSCCVCVYVGGCYKSGNCIRSTFNRITWILSFGIDTCRSIVNTCVCSGFQYNPYHSIYEKMSYVTEALICRNMLCFVQAWKMRHIYGKTAINSLLWKPWRYPTVWYSHTADTDMHTLHRCWISCCIWDVWFP